MAFGNPTRYTSQSRYIWRVKRAPCKISIANTDKAVSEGVTAAHTPAQMISYFCTCAQRVPVSLFCSVWKPVLELCLTELTSTCIHSQRVMLLLSCCWWEIPSLYFIIMTRLHGFSMPNKGLKSIILSQFLFRAKLVLYQLSAFFLFKLGW